MSELTVLGSEIGALLKAKGHSIAVAESSAGGVINAALLSVAGASAWYLGGAIVYTKVARDQLMGIPNAEVKGMRSASEPYARLLALRMREKLGATWGLSESGATGPTGNRYGDAAGHACIAVSGPRDAVLTIETGSADREANMHEFARRALDLLLSSLRD